MEATISRNRGSLPDTFPLHQATPEDRLECWAQAAVLVYETDDSGVQICLCSHRLERCDICCVDHSMTNDFNRKSAAVKSGKKDIKDRRIEACESGCCNPSCTTPKEEINKYLSCSGCRAVAYCGKDCQRDHWKEHKKPCLETRPMFRMPFNGPKVRQLLMGSTVEYLAEGQQTGVLCKIVSFVPSTISYVLQDLETTPLEVIKAGTVGPTAFLDRNSQIHNSKPHHAWKILQGDQLVKLGYFESQRHARLDTTLSTAIHFFPYGNGPYAEGEVLQQSVNNRPTLLFSQIQEVIYPPGQEEPPRYQGKDYLTPCGRGGDFGAGINDKALQAYKYRIRRVPRGRLASKSFSVDAEDLHDETKWQPYSKSFQK